MVALVVTTIHIVGLQGVLHILIEVAEVIHPSTHPMVEETGGMGLGQCFILHMEAQTGDMLGNLDDA